jgi:hypothetical protein
LLFFAAFSSAAERYVYPQQQYRQQSLKEGLRLNFAGAGIQYPNIQAAIDDACDGDTIYLAPGRFTGFGNRDIDFKGKAITVSSLDPNDPCIAAATIIDCNGSETDNHRGFTFHNKEEPNSVLAGLTVTNGYIVTCDESGAGIYMKRSSPTINKCVVTNNHTKVTLGCLGTCNGGGIYINLGHPLITSCTISGNSRGGGIYSYSSGATIQNCLISGNTKGGGIFCVGGSLKVNNCTIVANSYVGIGIFDGSLTIRNSIIWDNLLDQIYGDKTRVFITYSGIEGGLGNTDADPCNPYPEDGWPSLLGDINADPCFVEPGYWDSNGTPDNANDDFWVDGDYHLKSEGWRWDADANQWTWDDVTSRCIDAGNPGFPLGDEPITLSVDPLHRFGVNKRIDMGVYGGTAEASMPPYGWALLSDIDNNGKVNFVDFYYLANYYLQEGEKLNSDLNRDGAVNLKDLSLIALDWLKFTDWAVGR